ncbi:hypothetical protein J6U76_03055 [bacterium]|nr:hypothetical protein [bacterium]
MNKILTLALCLLFVLTGCKKAGNNSGDNTSPASDEARQAQAAQQAMAEQMNDPDYQTMQSIVMGAIEDGDWQSALAKIDELIPKFEENSKKWQAAVSMKFSFLLFLRKVDEAKKIAESMPLIQEQIEKEKDFYSECNLTLLEAATFIGLGKTEKGEELLDKVVANEENPPVARQKSLATKAMLALRVKGDSEAFTELMDKALAIDPDSDLGKQLASQLEMVKNMMEQSKEAQEAETVNEESQEEEEAIKEPVE